MNNVEERLSLLLCLHELSRTGCPADLGVLAGRLGWGVGRVVRVIEALDGKGLVDRPRCRLTMAGLAIAASVAASQSAAHRAA